MTTDELKQGAMQERMDTLEIIDRIQAKSDKINSMRRAIEALKKESNSLESQVTGLEAERKIEQAELDHKLGMSR